MKVIEENGWTKQLPSYILGDIYGAFDINNINTKSEIETMFELSKQAIVPIKLNHGVTTTNNCFTCDSLGAVKRCDDWKSLLLNNQNWCQTSEEVRDTFSDIVFNFELAIENNSFVAYEPNISDGIKIKLAESPDFMYCYVKES